MRFDHFHGLSPFSRRLIEATVKVQEQVRRVYPDGRSEEFVRDEIPALAKVERLQAIRGQYKRVAGYLHRYTMVDGWVATTVSALVTGSKRVTVVAPPGLLNM